MINKVNIGILGLGVVGSGVVSLLQQNSDVIKKFGTEIIIKKIADIDLKRKREIKVNEKILTTDAEEVVNDKDIDIIVEVIGGIGDAKDYIISAIKNKKHIVTSNKELIAKWGKKIFFLADKNKVEVKFEGSVGGGIPIIFLLRQCLRANKIEEIVGILNGTTNYILSKMQNDNMEFSEALKLAQNMGFAETNPVSDIEGWDPMYKISILSTVGWGTSIPLSKIYREGISRITFSDIKYAESLGYVIKLLAIAKCYNEDIEIKVHPSLIRKLHPLAQVQDEFNAIFVRGNAVGDLMFYGKGAGSLPAASAVVGDIIEIARNIKVPYSSLNLIKNSCYKIRNIGDAYSSFYIRLTAQDEPGVLAKIAKIFGKNKVSISQAIQKESKENLAEIVFVTHQVKEHNFKKSIKEIEKIKVVKNIGNFIRVVDI